jgi:hypothetical protein
MVFWKTLGEGFFFPKNFWFENLYGFFTRYEKPLWVFSKTVRGSKYVLVKNP